MDLIKIGKNAKIASYELSKLSTIEKNNILKTISKNLIERKLEIIEANNTDILQAQNMGLNSGLIDRLMLNENRIMSMKDGIDKIISLDDPVGDVIEMKLMPNGLKIGKKRVPIGVIGIIYESRPNVTVDTSSLCMKSSNALILRGGKEAINSNIAIVNIIRDSIKEIGYNENIIQLIENPSHEIAKKFMMLNEYVDVLIPRGSQTLINTVIKNSTIPVIETGTGNCHVFVDESADFKMAIDIIENSKTQRIGVCNAMESLLIHEKVAKEFIELLIPLVKKYNITVKADENARNLCPFFEVATDEDFKTEYLDYIFSLKIVDNINVAIEHINNYGTKHSESIITSSYENAMKFHELVDAAAVYINASTRFTDGSEFGMGAEMGISTQKLHARGPIGLKELTTCKYIIFGNGQIR